MTTDNPMSHFLSFRWLGIPVVATLLVLSACDSNDPDPHDEHFGLPDRVEVRDRTSNDLLAVWERSAGTTFDDHVHLHPGDELELNVLFFDEEGNEAHLGSGEDFTLGIRLAESESEGVEGIPGVVEFDVHGDHADVEAVDEGTTWLVFQLMHGNHSDGDSGALEFEVVDHDHS